MSFQKKVGMDIKNSGKNDRGQKRLEIKFISGASNALPAIVKNFPGHDSEMTEAVLRDMAEQIDYCSRSSVKSK